MVWTAKQAPPYISIFQTEIANLKLKDKKSKDSKQKKRFLIVFAYFVVVQLLDFNILRQSPKSLQKKWIRQYGGLTFFIDPASIIVRVQAYYVDGDSHKDIAIIVDVDVDLDLHVEFDVDDNVYYWFCAFKQNIFSEKYD